jgi:predicted transposase YbfD/YdcC
VETHKRIGGKKFFRKYNPLVPREECKMMRDCVVLLWASRNRSKEASITMISEETGIPRMTLHWILEDVFDRKENSILARAARSNNYDFMVYRTWNTTNKYKRRKKIIDAVKVNDPFRGKDY